MKLGDIYVSKSKNKKRERSIIQIDSFATHMNNFKNDGLIVIFTNIEKHNEFEIGYYPSFNGYGSKKEIEEKYQLLIPQEELEKYSDWSEIFMLAVDIG